MMKMQFKKTKISITATIILALLMISSALLAFSMSTETTVKAATTIPSNLLQYEWPQARAGPSGTFFSAGPAPSSPNLKWKTKIPGVAGAPVAFNGFVFVQALGTTYALDGGTGDIVWAAPGLAGAIGKLDNNYMVVGNKGVRISDGSIVWEGPPNFSFNTMGFFGVGYIPEEKLIINNDALDRHKNLLSNVAWSIPDPSQPPTLAWNKTGEFIYGDMYAHAYGDGKIFYGTYDNFLICVEASTGDILWVTPTTGGLFYGGSYLDGKFIIGELSNNMHAYDADTGELLWTYNPETWYGMWASSTAVGYGMVYEHNEDTYLYAINADTGELVWKAKGPGIAYSNILVIGDGKVYCQMGETRYSDFATGEFAYSEYNCYDAYTGELIWSIPMENGSPINQECIAYGNLYVVPTTPYPTDIGVWWYTSTTPGGGGSVGEVWCISSDVVDWPMYHSNPEHTAEGNGPTNLALDWKFEADAPIQSSPTIVDGVVYFGTHVGTIYAIDAKTGTELWTFKTDHWVKSTVAVVNGKLYTGADDGNIYCLNAATGAKLWETFAGGVVEQPIYTIATFNGADNPRSSPIVYENRVYVGSLDGNLYCLDANNGNVIWKFKAGLAVFATPTVVNDELYITATTPYPNGSVYKLDLNGNVIWQKEIAYVLDRNFEQKNYIQASVTVAEGLAFVRNGIRGNYALDATTGEMIWNYTGMWNPGAPHPGGVVQFMPMLYMYGRLYFNDYYGITCLNATDGTRLFWSYIGRENLAAGLSYSYKRIYTVTEYGVLFVLDALSGEKLSYYELKPACQLHSMPVPYDGYLYLGSNDWNMYCFGEARTMSPQPAPEASISASQSMPPEAESKELSGASGFTSTEITIITAVAIAVVIGIVAYWALRKRK